MKVLIVCGGTGGHIFPALSTAFTLTKKSPGVQVFFATDARGARIIPKDYPIFKLSIEQISLKGPLCLAKSVVKLFITFGQSLSILNKISPDIVVGFGGYAAGPALLLAALKKVPVLIHEQNVLPGKANRILSRFVNNIAVSFYETKRYLPRRKTILTGCPLRQGLFDNVSRKEALRFFGFRDDKFTILVMGGTSGAASINHTFLETLSYLEDIQIIHLTGSKDYDFVISEYEKLGNVGFKAFPFLEKMQYAYALADLIVARAGALTLAEIAFFGKPAILIPYPYAGAHQMVNASLFEKNNAAILIKDQDLNPQLLKTTIQDLSKDKQRFPLMRQNALALSRPNAHEDLAQEILSLIN